jgi:hypothetical protein
LPAAVVEVGHNSVNIRPRRPDVQAHHGMDFNQQGRRHIWPLSVSHVPVPAEQHRATKLTQMMSTLFVGSKWSIESNHGTLW